jgi:transcriptional regulator with XRE-family HTH domain
MTDRPVTEVLRDLIEEHGLTFRALAARIGVSHAHLVNIAQSRKPASGELAARIATALGLREDHFPETREAAVIDAVRSDPAYRDRLYAALLRNGRGARR